jgi:ferritin
MLKKLISHPVELVLQQAIHAELYASHLYKHIANQCQRLGLFGASKWFQKESADELEHYQKLANYLNDRGCVAEIPALEACDEVVGNLQDALELAYDTEVTLGNRYNKWFDQVDPMTKQLLMFYLEKQSKSTGEYGDWLSRLALAGKDECAILIIDKELGA